MDSGPHVMDMGPDSVEYALRAARWLGVALDESQLETLTRFRNWLLDEAIPGGGVGPNEAKRLWSRHIADALLFGLVFKENTQDCIDLGSGAGLPGIPLAILRRDISFALVDKSARRCEMLNRITAVLRLDNCTVINSDISAVDREWECVVSRAAMPLENLMFHVKRLLGDGGEAVVGLTRSSEPDLPAVPSVPGLDATLVEIPTNILDSPAILLRIIAN